MTVRQVGCAAVKLPMGVPSSSRLPAACSKVDVMLPPTVKRLLPAIDSIFSWHGHLPRTCGC